MELFVFDIDGTLSRNGAPLTPLEKETMNHVLKAGNGIAIASGRSLPTVRKYLDELIPSPYKYSICSNGADVYGSDYKPIFSQGLQFKDYEYLYKKYINLVPDTEIYSFNRNDIASYKTGYWLEWEIKTGNMPGMMDYSKHPLKEDGYVSKILIANKTSEESLEVERSISKEDRERFHIVRSSPYFLEFVNQNTDKKTAIDFLVKMNKMKKEAVHVFGDANNDYKMMEAFDGTAMGNAIPEIKALAKRVTKSVDEDGVGYALRTFFHF